MSMKTSLATTGHGLVRVSQSESEEWTLELLLPGLPALYRAQAKQIGILGLVGVVLLWVGMLLFLLVLSGVQILDIAVPGSIPHPRGDGPPLAIIPALLGAVLSTGVLPHWVGWLAIVYGLAGLGLLGFTGDSYPVLNHLMPLLMGILLLL